MWLKFCLLNVVRMQAALFEITANQLALGGIGGVLALVIHQLLSRALDHPVVDALAPLSLTESETSLAVGLIGHLFSPSVWRELAWFIVGSIVGVSLGPLADIVHLGRQGWSRLVRRCEWWLQGQPRPPRPFALPPQ